MKYLTTAFKSHKDKRQTLRLEETPPEMACKVSMTQDKVPSNEKQEHRLTLMLFGGWLKISCSYGTSSLKQVLSRAIY